MKYDFNSKQALREVLLWLRNWFDNNGKDCNAVIGISGGKDSNIVAALCVNVLGQDRVIGVRMPNGEQSDIDVAKDLCDTLGIKSYEINIKGMFDAEVEQLKKAGIEPSEQTLINIAPRLRMTTLYAVAQSNNGRVINTSNLSEDWVGYMTRWGDSVGDCMPLAMLTVQEVKAIGYKLGLDKRFIEKVPIDGLVGVTDEEKMGFTYKALDEYLRTGVCESEETLAKIQSKHEKNKFKLEEVPMFKPSRELLYSGEMLPTLTDKRNNF